MPSAMDWLVKRISALTRTATDADLTDNEYMAVDNASAYTRKITVANLAKWVLGKIKSLAATATAEDLVAGNYFVIDGPGGTKKLSAEELAVDGELDGDSDKAVSNAAVTAAIGDIESLLEDL